jgi:hypothetical protein
LIYLAGNNYTSDIVDIGFVGNYSNGACTTLHTGVFRDAGSKEWYFFENYAREPENNVIDPNGNNFTISVLNATLRTSNIILAGINAVSWISSAYDKANSAAQTVPQNAQNSNYTLTLGDAGKYIYYTQGTSVNLYIPTTGNVAFPNGTSIMIVSRTTSSANITITPNSGVSLFLAGNSTSATRNVTTYGMATLMHVEANTWFINGTGIV